MGGDLDVPIQPLGKPLWEYYCNFQEEFEGNDILKLNIVYSAWKKCTILKYTQNYKHKYTFYNTTEDLINKL